MTQIPDLEIELERSGAETFAVSLRLARPDSDADVSRREDGLRFAIAELNGLRPLLIDLRGAPRLAGVTAEVAAELFAEFERHSVRLGVVVGPDLVHAARVHRLLDFHAPTLGRCFLTEDEGIDWVVRGSWPLVPPSPVVARPWTRSRPYLSVASAQR